MARPISDEELQLKKRARRRLVGAIVLVTAVAVILPMVLDSEPKPVTQNVDIQIPSPDSGELKLKASAPPPVTAASPKASAVPETSPIKGMPQAPAAAAKDAPKAEAPAKVAETRPVEEKAHEAKDEAKPHAKTASTKDGATVSGAYVVQVAALADAARVKQLQKQMTAAGVKTYTEAVTTKSGEITRVRAGPYATREAAETARDTLKKAGLDGKVVAK
ncbi:MAG TPA: SPOR domain-containing protein [Burkholderiales bacterium]|nr:SPOR domain-containing protein [Burkholderiales bacterium]